MDDGGPAFPWSARGPNYQDHSGMSLRDYFAGQALIGLLARGERLGGGVAGSVCYQFADDMIKGRNNA